MEVLNKYYEKLLIVSFRAELTYQTLLHFHPEGSLVESDCQVFFVPIYLHLYSQTRYGYGLRSKLVKAKLILFYDRGSSGSTSKSLLGQR